MMQRQAAILDFLRKIAKEENLESLKIDYKEKNGEPTMDVRYKEKRP